MIQEACSGSNARQKPGTGSASYEQVKNWPSLPDSITLGNPTGIDMDRDGMLAVFHRAGRKWPAVCMPGDPIAANTVLFIDPATGKMKGSWGKSLFIMPHGLTVDRDNNIWLTDVGLQQVFKFTHDGKLLMTLGEARVAGDDHTHFDMPTATAIARDGSFYVSDGYGNSRVVKFSKEGKYLLEWGTKGNKEGEFNIPHALSLDKEGNVYVADRENSRIQVFTPIGKFLYQMTNESFGRIMVVAHDPKTMQLLAADDKTNLAFQHTGSDVLVLDKKNKVQSRFGRTGDYNGPVCWYHALCTDAEGNIYAGDILGNTLQKFKRK